MDDSDRLLAHAGPLLAALSESGEGSVIGAMLRAAPSFIGVLTTDARVVLVERHGVALTGVGSLQSYLADDAYAHLRACIDDIVARRAAGACELVVRLPDGSPAWFEVHGAPVMDGERVLGVVMVAHDLSRFIKDQRALQESEEKLRLAVDATGMGLWSWDAIRDEVVWDRRMCEIMRVTKGPRNRSEYMAMVHPDDAERLSGVIARALIGNTYDAIEHRVLCGDGTVRWVLSCAQVIRGPDGRVTRLMGGQLDVTERRQLLEQLMLAQKMEAVGQLTAGIAHNFNNMLMAILPTLELVSAQLEEPWRSFVTDAQHAGRRAAEMVRQLVTFAGPGVGDTSPARAMVAPGGDRAVEPAIKLVEHAATMCRELFQRHIDITVRDRSDGAYVRVNGGQMEQAVVNILLNARDAVVAARHESSTIEVVVDHVPAAAAHDHAREAGVPAGGDLVCVRVRDEGVGMSEAVRARIFDPFFTTKPVGRGTGLGLATTYAIIRDHEGFLRCESEPGRGTTMELYLPMARPPARERRRPPSRPPGPGSERILVVDDEPTLRRLVGYILADAGYQVVDAGDGAEALAALHRDPDIALVLLDRSMPGLPGDVALARIRELAPRVRVVYFTGQSGAPEGVSPDATVAKPIAAEDLLRTVRHVLDRGQ
jgi:PAS domain S-box-containing protein